MPADNHRGRDGSLPAQRRSHAAISQPALRGIRNKHEILHPPWTAARLAYKTKDFFSRNTATPITTIGSPDLFNHASSLAFFPAALACPRPSITTITALFRQALPVLSRSVRSFYHIHLYSRLTATPSTTTPTPTPNSRSPNTTSTHPIIAPHNHNTTTPPHYRYLQTALLPLTPRAALARLLIAATLNHIRRTLAPQLGGYLWHVHPLDGLRLAVSNPEVFVAEMLGGVMPPMDMSGGAGGVMGVRGVRRAVVGAALAAGRVMGGLLVKGGLDLAAAWAGAVLVEGYRDGEGVGGVVGLEGRVVDGNRGWEKRRAEREKRRMKAWLQVLAVGYFLWVLLTVEYVFARGVNTAAWLVACYRLLVGGRVGRIALVRTLESNWAQLPFVAWQLVHYLGHGVGPLLWRSVWCAVRGRPALLLGVVGVVGGVRMLLKYRSTFYIALEVSGVFVFLGYLLIAFVVLGLGLLGQPELTGTTPAKAQKSNAGGRLYQGLKLKTAAIKASFNRTSMPQSRKRPGKQGVSGKRV